MSLLTSSVARDGSAGGDPARTVLWVDGEHDIMTSGALAVSISRSARLGDLPLLIDLSGVTFMDCSTVGAIVGSRNRLRLRGRDLAVRAPSPCALRILELCGLADLVERGAARSTGATALGTWVDVPPIDPRAAIEHEAAPAAARPAAPTTVEPATAAPMSPKRT